MSIIDSRTMPMPGTPASRFIVAQTLQRARLLRMLEELEDRTVRGWHGGRSGGVHRVRDVRARARDLATYIADEVTHGSRRHGTTPRWLRWLALVPLTTDFAIVSLYFFVVLNVPLDRPMATPVQSFTALAFALVISLGLFLALRWVAVRRRGCKNNAGRFEAPEDSGRWLARAEVVIVGALLLGIAMVMLVRVLSDAQEAGVDLRAVWVVAGFLSLVTAVLNWCLYYIEFADGSEETHELDHWGRQLAPVDREAQRLRARLHDIDAQLSLTRAVDR